MIDVVTDQVVDMAPQGHARSAARAFIAAGCLVFISGCSTWQGVLTWTTPTSSLNPGADTFLWELGGAVFLLMAGAASGNGLTHHEQHTRLQIEQRIRHMCEDCNFNWDTDT